MEGNRRAKELGELQKEYLKIKMHKQELLHELRLMRMNREEKQVRGLCV